MENAIATEIPLCDLKEGEFFLLHGELYYIRNWYSNQGEAYVVQVANVMSRHCGDGTGLMCATEYVNPVCFLIQ